jgi:hypothetical protein
MRAVVVYESMYGNTREIAQAIASGIDPTAVVVTVSNVDDQMISSADLVVVGGPTHVFSMTRPKTRIAAAEAAVKPASRLNLEPDATGPGVREWLDTFKTDRGFAAAFDTRVRMPGLIGHAAPQIARRLRGCGFDLVGKPEGFFVTKNNQLCAGELERAQAWGTSLASLLSMSRK